MGYYFISIGGSGAKVMESLAHLCAAGILPNKEKQEKLYVMAVDPDIGNGNLKRSSAALNSLEIFQDFAVGTNTPLLKTEVELAKPFIWSPTEQDKKLDDIMSYQAYKGTPLGSLYEALYTKDERNTFLNEGFRGRPSIGAAVMAKKAALFSTEGWEDNADAPWDKFARLVKRDVKSGQVARIFLAGSVFGGTGAAGMPTIARLLHREFESYCEKGDVIIGGALVLPYFSFTPTQTENQIFASSENFLTNTKAALKYYSVKDKVYNTMYFIGDDVLSPVKDFSVGAASQNNDAHIVDLYGALAAVDFFQADPADMKKCSFITHSVEDCFKWTDFPDVHMADGQDIRIKDRFGQFVRFIFSYIHFIKPVLSTLASGQDKAYKYPWYVDYLDGVDVDTNEVKNFETYAESFVRWLDQMESSETRRRIELVRRDSFASGPACIDASKFAYCICDEESKITMNELWYRLSEHPGKDNENASGFGRFLRALYDCCEKD